VFRRRRALDDLDRDISDHIARETDENIERGLPPEEARRQALLAFGNVSLVKEDTRAVWVRRWIDDLRQDVRYALRTIGRTPGFAAVVGLTLALGLGANTAVFSLVKTVLLQTLPVEQPADLVFLRRSPPYPSFVQLREQTSSFAGMAAFATDELRLDVDGTVEQVFGQVASGSYFDVLGVAPAAGRLMTADDERLDPPVAVVGYAYAQRRFGRATAAIGRRITFGGRIYTVVGVTAAGFWGLEPGRRVDVTLPITQDPGMVENRRARWFNTVARLRPGTTRQQAATDANRIFQSSTQDGGPSADGAPAGAERLELVPAAWGLDQLRSRLAAPLYVLTMAAAFVLLITCANIGGLLFVRGATRARELAVRLATGAGVGRLVRQLLTETLVLFLFGAAAGMGIAHLTIQGLTGFFAAGRRPILLDVQYDWRLIAYAAAMTLAAALVAGLWPALRALRVEARDAMKETAPRFAGLRRMAAGRVFVAGQAALSLALLVAAALFARTIMNLRAIDLGFAAADVLTLSISPDPRPGMTPAAQDQLWMQVLERVRGLPGVHAASLSVLTPLSGRNTGTALIVPGFGPAQVRLNHVSEDYFQAFGISLIAGRAFTRRDAVGAPRVALLNETAAAAAFGGRSPIGEVVRLGQSDAYQVVGVVRDYKHLSVREPAPPFVFVPLWQPIDPRSRLTLAVSSDQPPPALARAIAEEVGAVHPGALVSDVIDVQDQIDATLVSERLLSMLASGFAALVLALAAIGLYGIVSYYVASRRAEFGIRVALGASRSRVAAGVVNEALLHVAAGIALGLPLALLVARVSERLLFEVTAADPVNYLLAAAALGIAAAAAAWLPARRACSIDPAETLRRA
jgi:predicted permease